MNIDCLKIFREECPDMWKIRDVKLIDPNAVEYFTGLDSMQCKKGDERVKAKKQDAFKHLHEHLILELAYLEQPKKDPCFRLYAKSKLYGVRAMNNSKPS